MFADMPLDNRTVDQITAVTVSLALAGRQKNVPAACETI